MHRLHDGHAMRAEERAGARAARYLSRRPDDPPPFHVEGQLHRASLHRVSAYAAIIARECMHLSDEIIEDIKAAAMLHDIGKLDISRDLLYKAAKLTNEEYEEIKQHVSKGIGLLEPVGGSLRRVIPIVLAHHDKFDGTGLSPDEGRSDSDRVAHHCRCRCVRFADERSALSEGDVAFRSARHHREGVRDRVRSESGGSLPEGVPPGQARSVGCTDYGGVKLNKRTGDQENRRSSLKKNSPDLLISCLLFFLLFEDLCASCLQLVGRRSAGRACAARVL